LQPGPDSIGIIAVSHNCIGVAARACGLVSLEPTKVAEILKDRPSWYRDCRCVEILHVFPTGNGGTIELIYMQVCVCSPMSCRFHVLVAVLVHLLVLMMIILILIP
jgi:hypothetical protein